MKTFFRSATERKQFARMHGYKILKYFSIIYGVFMAGGIGMAIYLSIGEFPEYEQISKSNNLYFDLEPRVAIIDNFEKQEPVSEFKQYLVDLSILNNNYKNSSIDRDFNKTVWIYNSLDDTKKSSYLSNVKNVDEWSIANTGGLHLLCASLMSIDLSVAASEEYHKTIEITTATWLITGGVIVVLFLIFLAYISGPKIRNKLLF